MSSPYINNKESNIKCSGSTAFYALIILLTILIIYYVHMHCNHAGVQSTAVNYTNNLVSNFIGKPKLFKENQEHMTVRHQIDDRPGHENPMERDYTNRIQLGEFNGVQRERLRNIEKIEDPPMMNQSSHVPTLSEEVLMGKLS